MFVRRFEPNESSTEITLAIERCKCLSISRFVNLSTVPLFFNCHKGFRVARGSSRRAQPQDALTFSTSQTSCCLRLHEHHVDRADLREDSRLVANFELVALIAKRRLIEGLFDFAFP